LTDVDGNAPEGYEQFEATALYCPHCKEAVPVRKKLLLILPEGDEYEYLCSRCGSSVGIKLEKSKEEIKVLI
jgi:DNA-directed RNA polymerase subunit RPC12/RpoP